MNTALDRVIANSFHQVLWLNIRMSIVLFKVTFVIGSIQ
jgi:hypothetical protein